MYGFSNDFNLDSPEGNDQSRGIQGFFEEFLPESFALPSFGLAELSPRIDDSLPECLFVDNKLYFPPEASVTRNTDLIAKDNSAQVKKASNKKTKLTLQLTPKTTEDSIDTSITDKNVEAKVNTLLSARKRPGPFIIEKVVNKNSGNTELDRAKNNILAELRTWTADFDNHKHIIDLLENYKKLVLSYTAEYLNKKNELNEFKDSLINSLNNKNAMKKEYNRHNKQKRAKGKKIWDQVDSYLEDISPIVKKSFEKLLTSTYKNTIPNGLLNMNTVNKLAAIAKMLQYCCDNKVTVKEFLGDGVYSKMKAKCAVNKTVYTPNLNEIGYLLSLDTHSLDETINSLKNKVQYKPSLAHTLEEQTNKLSMNNKNIIKQILKRINNPKSSLMCSKPETRNPELKKVTNSSMTPTQFQALKNLIPFPSVQRKNNVKLKK
jgi:hypothetical protein